MLIIPVLDIQDGLVVRARMGLRDTYRPIETPLSPTAMIGDVAAGLMTIHPFPVFYVADLDAIVNDSGFSPSRLQALSALEPAPTIWLDAGLRRADDIRMALQMPGLCPVLGSESLSDLSLPEAFCHDPRLILSLDFREGGFIGPADLLSRVDLWPSRIIVMTLAKVGANAGPDFDRLEQIRSLAPDREIIAAGGVRNADDMTGLERLGIKGALVATALHSGALTKDSISKSMKTGIASVR